MIFIDMLIYDHAFQRDAGNNENKIFVGGLSSNTTEDDLRRFFSAIGKVGIRRLLTYNKEYRMFHTKDFSHKSFSTSFGLCAQFLEVILHNNYK